MEVGCRVSQARRDSALCHNHKKKKGRELHREDGARVPCAAAAAATVVAAGGLSFRVRHAVAVTIGVDPQPGVVGGSARVERHHPAGRHLEGKESLATGFAKCMGRALGRPGHGLTACDVGTCGSSPTGRGDVRSSSNTQGEGTARRKGAGWVFGCFPVSAGSRPAFAACCTVVPVHHRVVGVRRGDL